MYINNKQLIVQQQAIIITVIANERWDNLSVNSWSVSVISLNIKIVFMITRFRIAITEITVAPHMIIAGFPAIPHEAIIMSKQDVRLRSITNVRTMINTSEPPMMESL